VSDEAAIAEGFSDIPPEFHLVVVKYGREMFALVMNAGVAGQAASILGSLATKHASRGGIHAVGVWAQCFNAVSNDYVAKMGWSAELLAQCDRDIQLAFRGKIIEPTSKLVLDS
jgi:hypothetical protein